MDKKVIACPECNTVNYADATHCRECGAYLSPDAPFVDASVPQSVAYHDIEDDELRAFYGVHAHKFIRRHRRFESGRRVAVSASLIILGVFFGPIAQGFWFLRRKMYLFGLCLLLIGLALTGASSYMTAVESSAVFQEEYVMVGDLMDQGYSSEDMLKAFISGDFTLSGEAKAEIEKINQNTPDYTVYLNMINAANLAVAVIVILFGNYAYYRHALKKIGQVRERCSSCERAVYLEYLTYSGGVKNSIWIIAMILCFFVLGSVTYNITAESLSMLMTLTR